ncbi:hypothetical protein HPP92_029135 [Vanilla planifolia]|uniref:Uncharacterized protein n=1 Tax=Vanilla planifolia TaxID=51239 RepID=A0A835P3H4_VANPL|nr:hypothetical protein HPP92_029135 [Vanilla planifolia]KAG0445854.1 hypothetical protein HPP92_029124 [Vanilla planifolia]
MAKQLRVPMYLLSDKSGREIGASNEIGVANRNHRSGLGVSIRRDGSGMNRGIPNRRATLRHTTQRWSGRRASSNVPPNSAGLMSDADIDSQKISSPGHGPSSEKHREWKQCDGPAASVEVRQFTAKNVLGRIETYWTPEGPGQEGIGSSCGD